MNTTSPPSAARCSLYIIAAQRRTRHHLSTLRSTMYRDRTRNRGNRKPPKPNFETNDEPLSSAESEAASEPAAADEGEEAGRSGEGGGIEPAEDRRTPTDNARPNRRPGGPVIGNRGRAEEGESEQPGPEVVVDPLEQELADKDDLDGAILKDPQFNALKNDFKIFLGNGPNEKQRAKLKASIDRLVKIKSLYGKNFTVPSNRRDVEALFDGSKAANAKLDKELPGSPDHFSTDDETLAFKRYVAVATGYDLNDETQRSAALKAVRGKIPNYLNLMRDYSNAGSGWPKRRTFTRKKDVLDPNSSYQVNEVTGEPTAMLRAQMCQAVFNKTLLKANKLKEQERFMAKETLNAVLDWKDFPPAEGEHALHAPHEAWVDDNYQ
ncbi:uncharacterized protein I303_100002 [Kwoniella dejecticola CBS 10117]|uniref:Uncharacterized protein n=1 Tax=Kwoniella dejecticola CBS 10117 TaxID=1296121 RepID=A0A1A6ADP2_9TREE|nr:uncharacterized protein I303_00002 [Kwoniella dejecticola CBS 10117]OBR88191.1 hypothetical protein I303_00002 [Kwoniella dejecticola CBS 10117]